MPHKDPEVRKQYLKDWRKENAEYIRQFDKKRYDSGEHGKEVRKQNRYKNPGQNNAAMRKWLYGISKEEYEAKVKEQNNLCALCGEPESHICYRTRKVFALSVDHNHTTDKNRDLLCMDCNRGIGIFKEDINLLRKAIQYLEKHKE